MAKFQVFQSNLSFIARMGFFTDPWNTIFTRLLAYTCLIHTVHFGFVTSLILIYENLSNSPFVLELALCIAMLQLLGVYFIVRINRDKVDILHPKLQKIVD